MSNLDLRLFAKELARLAENFNFKFLPIYSETIFEGIRKAGVTNENMVKIAASVIETTTAEDWAKAYGYGGKPPLADWLKVFAPKPIEKIIFEREPITGATVARRISIDPKKLLKKVLV